GGARPSRWWRRPPLGGEGPDRARADRWTRPLPVGADSDRGTGGGAGGRRPHQPRGRGGAVHQRAYGRLEPPQDLRQARHPLPARARSAPAAADPRLTRPRPAIPAILAGFVPAPSLSPPPRCP